MLTAVARIRGMTDAQARSLGFTVISPESLLQERETEARFMDYPRAIAKIAAVDTMGNRYLQLHKEKAMLELALKFDGGENVQRRSKTPCGVNE